MKSRFNGRKALLAWFGSGLLAFSASVMAVEYQPNFKGTEIEEFINIVGKNLNKTIIVDPNVRGKINVRSYEMLNEQQYWQFFLNVLEVYDFSIVEMDSGVLKVMRQKDAKTSNIPVVGDKNPGIGDEMVTRVVQVKNVPVREMSSLLRQFIDQTGGGHVVHYDPSNVIMMTGQAEVMNRLVDIIKLVDRAGNQEVDIVRLSYASAGEMVRILENIYGKKQGQPDQPDFLIPKFVADERTNSVIVSGELQARQRINEMIKRLDAQQENQGNTRIHFLKYSKAEDIVKVLNGVSSGISAATQTQSQQSNGGGQARSMSGRDVTIEAHPETNAVIITAQPDMLRSLENVVRQLDIRRAQVLVEAIIVEVGDTAGINLGVQWGHKDGAFQQFTNAGAPISQVAAGALMVNQRQQGAVVETKAADGTVTTTRPQLEPRNYEQIGKALSGVSGAMLGFVHKDFGAILNAVSNDSNSNILATPHLTTLDNQESSFIVGEEVPIETGTTSGGAGTGSGVGSPFTTKERKEIGIKLKVTPQINEGNAVKLVIEQEVSSRSNVAIDGDIIINKREIKTTVMAEDGGTVVLGGLIDEDVLQSESKVPLLGDIPVIGHLFRSTNTSKRKRNLMVFIRPTILRDGGVMNQISQRKYNYIRAEQLQMQDDGISLMPNTAAPALPSWGNDRELPAEIRQRLEQMQQEQAEQKKSATGNPADALQGNDK
jgi:general secretion pathway protein D